MTQFAPRPEPCNPAPGLVCENPDHDHHAEVGKIDMRAGPDGRALCNDCGKPVFWCFVTQQWWHDSAGTCFLIPIEREVTC